MIIFFGSSEYSIPALKALLDAGFKVVVVTTPDKPVGRKQILTPNPLSQFSQDKRLPVFKIDQWTESQIPKDLTTAIKKSQIGVCCVYGKILPRWLIKKFKKGILNIHPSLLPKYRGASPAVGIILNQEKTSGFTIIKMDEKIDHGPIVFQEKFTLPGNITALSYYQQIFQKAALRLPTIINHYLSGLLKSRPQNHQKASFTFVLKKEDGFLRQDLLKKAINQEKVCFENLPPIFKNLLFKPQRKYCASRIVFNLYRAFYPWPGIWTTIKIGNQNKRLKIINVHLEKGKLVVDCVQLEGKKPTEFLQFKKDYYWDF